MATEDPATFKSRAPLRVRNRQNLQELFWICHRSHVTRGFAISFFFHAEPPKELLPKTLVR